MSIFARTLIRGKALRSELIRKSRELGVPRMLRHVLMKLFEDWRLVGSAGFARSDTFDAAYGTDTAKIVGVWALDIPPAKLEHANRYETIAPEVFSDSLGELKISHQDFVFIDLGSGKGRALLLASRFPFKEIIGVEISPSVNAVAARNLRIFVDSAQRCRQMRALCQDVLDYQFPDDNILIYMYNPFDEQLMESVVSKAEGFVRRSSKRVCVLYHHPVHRLVWDRSEIFRVATMRDRYVVYASWNKE